MSVKYKIIDQNGLNYLTLITVDWIDLFTRQVYREIVIDSLKYSDILLLDEKISKNYKFGSMTIFGSLVQAGL
jgi:hypothetical protein